MDSNITQAGPAERVEHGGHTDNSDRDASYRPPAPRSRAHLSTRSNFSGRTNLSMTSIPKEAKTSLTAASPQGATCVITQRRRHIECAHILPRSTKSPEREQLEFCWGEKPLNLDDSKNMMWLSPELHKCFDDHHWALVPSLQLLEMILDHTIDFAGLEKPPNYLTICGPETREYSFVQFLAGEEPIPRFDSTVPDGATLHQSPFTTLSPITSHIHPYFVICNVAQKDLRHHPPPNLPGPQLRELAGYEALDADLLKRVRVCRRIYGLWMSRKLPSSSDQLGSTDSLAALGSQTNPSAGHGSRRSSRLSRDQSKSKESGSKTAERDSERGKKHKAQSSGPTDSASSLGEPLSVDDELDALGGQPGDVDMPYWSKVGSWLRDVDDAIPATDSTFTGTATRPMEGVQPGWTSI